MRGFMHHRRQLSTSRSIAAIVAGALLISAALAPVSFAAAPAPASGSATVDGATGEWSLAGDFFSDMTDGGDAAKPVRAKLYLRYDCDTETLYGLVLAQGGEQVRQTRPDEAYLSVNGSKVVGGNSGNDGTPPDFAWVDGDGELADGFEASASVAPGSHTLRAHVLVADDSADGYTPMDTVGRTVPLVIECGEEQPTQSTGPTPTPTPTPTPSGEEQPTQGTGPTPTPSEAPAGNVGGATGRPRTTLPPTDAIPAMTPSTAVDGTGIVLVLLAAATGGFALLTPTRRSRRAVPELEESDGTR